MGQLADDGTRLRLHVVQAAYGDCLLVEAGAADRPRFLLVDGGPTETYHRHLRPLLRRLARRGQRIDTAVLSHIDNDHVRGLLAMFEELGQVDPEGRALLPSIRQLWHNSFAEALGSADLAPLVRGVMGDARIAPDAMPAFGRVLRGFEEGDALRHAARRSRVPLNRGFEGGQVLVETAPTNRLGRATVTVVGPSRGVLDDLREQWLRWLDRHRDRLRLGRATAVAADRSVPNLSSICLLIESGKRGILLTGDARGQQVVAGLRAAGLLGADGLRPISVLKLPHHGSARNVDRELLESVPADVYVISADGRYGNPDHEALALVVETAREAGRSIRLVATNPTSSIDRLLETHPPRSHGYTLRVLRPGRGVVTIDVRDARARP